MPNVTPFPERRSQGAWADASTDLAPTMPVPPPEVRMPPRILMCPPDYYGIEYEINPWMSRDRGSDPARARRQWHALADILRNLGVQVDLLTPQPGLPDLVFTANAGLMFHDRFYSARFRHAERARESPVYDEW